MEDRKMNINMKYGKTGLSLDLPEDIDVTLIQKKVMPVLKDPEGAIKAVFTSPVNCKTLREEVKGCRSCCILICDITRPVPNGLILPELIKELIKAGMSPDSITVLVATGLHRPNEGDELRELVGSDWVLDTVTVVNHFARQDDDHKYIGTTSNGIEAMDRPPLYPGRPPHCRGVGGAPLHGRLLRRKKNCRPGHCT